MYVGHKRGDKCVHPVLVQVVIGDQNGGLSILQLEGVRLGGEIMDTYRNAPEFGQRVLPGNVNTVRARKPASTASADDDDGGETKHHIGGLDDEIFDTSRGAASEAMSSWTSVPIVTITRIYYNEKCVHRQHGYAVVVQSLAMQDSQQCVAGIYGTRN